MITIVDYGMGNLRSVQKAFELYYSKVRISSIPEDILSSDKVVLPGVGAFSRAMEELKKRSLVDPIAEIVKKGKPFLGICLGLQLLFEESEEGGRVAGLNILKGKVRRFKDLNGLKIPHMGWNKVRTTHYARRTTILNNIADGSYMYFVHSYYVEPEDKNIAVCRTDYGLSFTSGIQRDNIYAFQFHPEKSQCLGLRIIKNFVDM
ncbi:MAG: imidazole glycerol phosphate synthase subunit HisH [Candidatus Omnitrophica bacterium]|nr:imidazole glycerol phosphate synthase subunit HisH [Candidatus Omnitrophota bacterium]